MGKHAMWKWLGLIGLLAWSLVLVTPIKEKVKLGLDLQGGISFLLEVDTTDIAPEKMAEAQQRALEVIRNRVDGMGTEEPIIYPEPRSNRIVVQIPGLSTDNRDWAIHTLESAAFLEFRMVHNDNDRLVQRLFDDGLAPPGYRIVTVDEPMPNGQRARRTYFAKDEETEVRIDKDTEREVRDRLRSFYAPPNYDMLLKRHEIGGQTYYEPYYVNRRQELTGDTLSSAGVDYQQFGQPIVTLKFDPEGTRRFQRVTSDNAPGGARNPSLDGRRFLAVVLDGVLHSAPFIRTPIYGGEAIIEGSFSLPEAQNLALVLNAGSLPAPLRVIEERNVDPTLGHDSIVSGARAIVMGGVLVLLFMLGYYLLAGVIANLALILDLLLLPLGMLIVSGFLGLITGGGGGAGLPTLTLPGIAGIVLTIGMAVDANVLIFERIREEQNVGKRLSAAIDAGFEKVFSTIMDANITTLLTAVILFWQGSGPIRGFAITLSAGIVVSMFVALVITRLMFDFVATKTKIQHIKMFNLVTASKFDFVGKRKLATIFSLSLIVVTMVFFVQRGSGNLGVDFTGGTSLTYQFAEKQSVDDVRGALASAGITDTFIQYQRELVPDDTGVVPEYLLLKVPYGEGGRAKEALTSTLPDAAFKILQEDTVGPQVGKDLRRQGLSAILWALLGIVVYVAIRFEFSFAIGAVVALLHDVIITVGLFCLMGFQLNLPTVAALLTIVGYSVNDTIVVFDRIREEIGLARDKNYERIANFSINQTLSRTLLTSFTTLLTVIMLVFFGGGAIKDFAVVLFIGIVIGTYSSIFIATPIMLLWHKDKPKG